MRLRGKLLIPIITAFFIGFMAFTVFLSLDQSRKKRAELAAYADNLAEPSPRRRTAPTSGIWIAKAWHRASLPSERSRKSYRSSCWIARGIRLQSSRLTKCHLPSFRGRLISFTMGIRWG